VVKVVPDAAPDTLTIIGKLCAVVVMNGSNKPRESPFYNANGKLLLDQTLVAGHRLLDGQPDDPGAEHRGPGDPGAAVGRLESARFRSAHQDQPGPGRHPHGPAPVESAPSAGFARAVVPGGRFGRGA
jgi:hypothetical protein